MKSANRVFKNTMFLYMRMAITVFISLYTTRLILNALGASDFGIFNLIGGLITMLIFLNASMTQASQRFMSYAQGKGDIKEQMGIFSVSVILHLLIAILSIILLEVAEPLLFRHVLKIDSNRIYAAKTIYQFMIVSSFFVIISVPFDAVINAHENMLFVAVLGVIESFFKLGIALFITQNDSDKLVIYGLLIAILSMAMVIIKAIYSHNKYDEVQISIKKNFDRAVFDKMLSFVGYTLLSSSISLISGYGIGIVLNIFFGTIVNAAQGIVNQVGGQLGAFANTMMKALNPLITKSEGSGNRQMMLDTSFVGTKISFFLLVFFYVPFLLEMPIIFKYWLINIPQYTIIFCTLMLARKLVEQLYVTLSAAIISVGNIKNFQIYNSILNLFPLPVSYVLFRYGYPPYFLYIVFLFYSLCQVVVFVLFAKKECGMSIRSYFKKVIVKSIIPFTLIFFIVAIPHIFMNEGLYRLLTVIAVNIPTFLLIVWFFGLTELEKQFIKQIIDKIRIKVHM